MYSRFTPMPDGTYQRRTVPAPPHAPPPAPPAPVPQAAAPSAHHPLTRLLPKEWELGDVLVLLIALVLLVDGGEDLQTILITAVAFFLL